MPMSAITDDLDVIFDDGVFAGVAKVTLSATGAVRDVKGIFDNGDVPTDANLSDMVETYVQQTTFQCAKADVEDLVVNDTLKIGSTTYYHAFWIDDGVGTVTIHLSGEAI